MRLFGKVTGTIDRFDRAGWMTTPFDLTLAAPTGGGGGAGGGVLVPMLGDREDHEALRSP